VIDWLLDGDPAIRWQTLRDLENASPEDVAADRAAVEHGGWGACLLAFELATGRSVRQPDVTACRPGVGSPRSDPPSAGGGLPIPEGRSSRE
jgi:hypothetical protein